MAGVQEPIASPQGDPRRLFVAGASVRAAAWSAVEAGFQVIAADLFGDEDLREVSDEVHVVGRADYPIGLADVARQIGPRVDGWIYTGGLENHAALVRQISQSIQLLGNGPNALDYVRNPFWLANTLRTFDIPCPSLAHSPTMGRAMGRTSGTRSASPEVDLAKKRWICKRTDSAAGHHVRFANPRTDQCEPNEYFQEFLVGPTFSAVYVSNRFGKNGTTSHLLGVTRQWIQSDLGIPSRSDTQTESADPLNENPLEADSMDGEPNGAVRRPSSIVVEAPFRYIGSTGPIALDSDEEAQWQRIGQVIASTAALDGIFGVDAVVVDDGGRSVVHPIEVNPRYTASVEIIERSIGRSLMRSHVEACLSHFNHEPDPAMTHQAERTHWGKRIQYATSPFAIARAAVARAADEPTPTRRQVPDWAAKRFPKPADAIEWRIADIPLPPYSDSPIPSGSPILTTLAKGISLAHVERALGFEALQ